MVELEFNYEQRKIIIQANLDDYFSTIINKYCLKTQIDKNSVIFMANTIQIKEDKKVKEIINPLEIINKKMCIVVFPLYKEKMKKSLLILKILFVRNVLNNAE